MGKRLRVIYQINDASPISVQARLRPCTSAPGGTPAGGAAAAARRRGHPHPGGVHTASSYHETNVTGACARLPPPPLCHCTAARGDTLSPVDDMPFPSPSPTAAALVQSKVPFGAPGAMFRVDNTTMGGDPALAVRRSWLWSCFCFLCVH